MTQDSTRLSVAQVVNSVKSSTGYKLMGELQPYQPASELQAAALPSSKLFHLFYVLSQVTIALHHCQKSAAPDSNLFRPVCCSTSFSWCPPKQSFPFLFPACVGGGCLTSSSCFCDPPVVCTREMGGKLRCL